MKENEGYKILMTDKQMKLMSEALEFYSRFLSGQLDHFPKALEKYMTNTKNVPNSHFDESIQKSLTDLQRILFPDLQGLNGSYGVGSDHIPETTLAYEMYKMINYTKEMEDPRDSWNVNQRPPLKHSSESLINIKKVNLNREINMDNLEEIIKDNCGTNPDDNCGDANEY